MSLVPRSAWPRRIALLGALAIGACTSGSATERDPLADPVAQARPEKLFKTGMHNYARWLAEGRPTVEVIIASKSSANGRVAALVAKLGGAVRYREDDVDYIRAKIPRDSLRALAASSDVFAIDPDVGNGEATTAPVQEAPVGKQGGLPPLDSTLALDNPYTALAAMGVVQFRTQHPTYDGRGVTIGVVDGTPDMLHSALQTALTLDGKSVPKYMGFHTVGGPRTNSDGWEEDPLWVNMRTSVNATGGVVTFNGRQYKTPGDGAFRIGAINERKVDSPSPTKNDLNRDGNPKGADSIFAVLWDEKTATIRVDVNQNHDFSDDKALRDVRRGGELGAFGQDNPKTPVRESLGFYVEIDSANTRVNVGVGSSGHGTMVSWSEAGNGLFGSKATGMAPNARLNSVNFRKGLAMSKMLEGMLEQLKNPAVDLGQMSAGDQAILNDGSNTMDVIYARMSRRYDKPIFVSAGNSGPGMSTIHGTAAGAGVFGIGAYKPSAIWRATGQTQVDSFDYLAGYSARGPAGNGAPHPDILAITETVSAAPAAMDQETVHEGEGEKVKLPPGWGIGGGTSQASPMAAGTAALLISAAKQETIPHGIRRLRAAVLGSARFLPSLGAYEQGNGLFDLPSAWDALKKMTSDPDPISVSAPVQTVLSKHLIPANSGPGFYEREGWTAGMRAGRTVTFLRAQGGREREEYAVQWLGNDGTFSSDSTIVLPRGKRVTFNVAVGPKTPGAHSALMRLIERPSGLTAHAVLFTVVAAAPLDSAHGFTAAVTATARRPAFASAFFRVEPGTRAVRFAVAATSGKVKLRFQDPTGKERQSATGATDYMTEARSESFANPMPGVWEIAVDNALDGWTIDPTHPKTLPPVTFTVTATAYTVNVDQQIINVSGSDAPMASLTGGGAPFAGGLAGGPLASVRGVQGNASLGAMDRYDIIVPKGAKRIWARVSKPGDAGADLDVYLFNCAADSSRKDSAVKQPPATDDASDKDPFPKCTLASRSIGEGADEIVSANDPKPGRWAVVVHTYAAPSGRTTYTYTDGFSHPDLGSATVADPPVAHAPGARWTASIRATPGKMPVDTGRVLGALLDLTSSDVYGVSYTQKGKKRPKPGTDGYTMTRLPVAIGSVEVRVVGKAK